MTGWERPSHWLVLAVVVLVLFGYKKLPDMSRSVGRSLRIFKTEMKGMSEDDGARDASSASPSQSAPQPPAVADAQLAAAAPPIVPAPPSVPAAPAVSAAPNGAAPAPAPVQPAGPAQPNGATPSLTKPATPEAEAVAGGQPNQSNA